MDAKKAAQIIKSGNYTASDFQILYAALNGKEEFAAEFEELRKAMLEAYAKGDSIEVNQSGQNVQPDEMLVEQTKGDSQNQEKQLRDIETWKIQRRQEIMQWAAKNKNSEIADIKANKEGLTTSFKDGTQVNFIAENHVSVKTSDEPKAQNFDMVIALAKENNKKIKLGENMTPEFRTALIEACAKSNVQISNLSVDDLDTYMKFLPKQKEEQQLNVVEQKETQQQSKVRQQSAVTKEKAESAERENSTPATQEDNGVAQVVAAVAANAAARENVAEQKPAAKKTSEDKGSERISQQAAEAAVIAREIQTMAKEQKQEQQSAPATVVEEKKQSTPQSNPVVLDRENQPDAKSADKEKELESAQPKPAVQKQDIAFIPPAREAVMEDVEEQDYKPQNAGKQSQADKNVAVVAEKQETKNDKPEQVKPQEKDVKAKGNQQPAKVETVTPQTDKQATQKEGFWKKWGRKIKHAAIIAGVAVASFFVGRCSSTPTEQGAGNNDGEKARTEIVTNPTVNPIVADTLQNDTTDTDFQIRMAPTKWNADMGITEAQFNNMYNIIHKHDAEGELWARMHLNAQLHAEEFSLDKSNPMTAEQFMFKALRVAAWTNRLNGKICETHGAEWAHNYSGTFGHILGPTMGVLKCGDHIDAVTLKKAQIMLSAVGTNGSINVFTLDKVVAGTSKFNNHDEQGWIIGTTNNRMTGIDVDCGRESEVEFNGNGKVVNKPTPKKKVTPREEAKQDTIVVKKDPIIIEIPGDTTVVKKPDVIIEIPGDTTVVVPTRATPTKVTPQAEPAGNVAIGSKANLSSRPAAEATQHTQSIVDNGSDKNLTGAQRRQARKMAKEMLDKGRIDQATYDRMLTEINGGQTSQGQRVNEGR